MQLSCRTKRDLSRNPRGRCSDAGFTLIEVIVSLLIISVMATMIYQATGGGLWRSSQGVGECIAHFELQGQMENIIKMYRQQLVADDGAVDLPAFHGSISSSPYMDAARTGYLVTVNNNLTFTPATTPLLMVTLTHGDQQVSSIFSQ